MSKEDKSERKEAKAGRKEKGRKDRGPKQRLTYINIRMSEIRDEMTRLNEERRALREQLGKQKGADKGGEEDDED